MRRFFLAWCFAVIATGVWAQDCVVNDPTGTPLNVRARPNGPILGALYNGASVRVLKTTFDHGRRWAYIAPLEAGKSGWIFADYLTCGHPALVACVGPLIDVDLDPQADFPLAVIYDSFNKYTCVIDRRSSGHDPLRPCSAPELCRVVGTAKKIGNTYHIIRLITVDMGNGP